MSLPPLPEPFGNNALAPFATITPPEAISWLPQTSHWLWLGAVLAGVLFWRIGLLGYRWHHNRYRREALQALLALETNTANYCAQVNHLLKGCALHQYPRSTVAPLWGIEWVLFLNRQCARPPFSKTSMDLLSQQSYHPAVVPEDQAAALGQQAADWLRNHRREQSA